MKVSEAIDRLEVGDTVWVKGEINYVNQSESFPVCCDLAETSIWICKADEISLTEPTKQVKIPEYVAEWIDYCKERGISLHTAMNHHSELLRRIEKTYKEMRSWLANDENYQEREEIFARAWLDGFTVEPKRWVVKEGDLVIRKGKHEAKIYFVEGADEDGILLVNGIQDEYYSDEDCNLDSFYEEFRLLAKKENLESEVEGSVEEV